MDQKLIDLYDDFVHVHFDRRQFLDRAAKIAGGTAAALALLPLLQSNYAKAALMAEDDPRVAAKRLTVPGATGPLKAYLATPQTPGKHGGILVIHQNRGLNPHIEDVTRRVAAEGYTALAIDFLSPLGGTPTDGDAATKMFGNLDPAQTTANGLAALKWLRAQPDSNGKTGVIGFCWGGGGVNQLAVADPALSAGVVYYGMPPDLTAVSKIEAPLLLNYADPTLDTRLGPMVPPYEAALKAAGKKFALYYYQGANHAFNDDTGAARYNEAAASLAWSRSFAFFKENLA